MGSVVEDDVVIVDPLLLSSLVVFLLFVNDLAEAEAGTGRGGLWSRDGKLPLV